MMGVAGLALAAFGLFEFFGAILALSTMQSYATAMNDKFGDMGTGPVMDVPEPPLGFLIQLLGVKAGIALVGIVLIVFAVRGLIARMRAGLPTDEEAVGKSFASRVGNSLIYGAGFAFGAFSL